MIALRPISEVDPDLLRSWRNDPAIYKWCRQTSPLEKWEHFRWLQSLENRADVKMFSIWAPEDFAVGVCGLTDLNMINRRAEFSIYIIKDHWRKNYGEKALRLLTKYGFDVLGLNHIFGETFEGNPAANMFEKVGFKLEGTRRQFYYREGKFIDAHLYSMLKSEFENARV